MGFISRKIFPACGRICICCPALRSRSRQPVKRYKKLVTEIFPKSPDGQPNDRKIVKLCEYAAKNPGRIPKITKYLEERLFKELRNGHQKIVNVIMEAYKKLLSICSNHMVYFASSVLNVTDELLDNARDSVLHITGCQTLTQFIYSQTDGTYARNVENLVRKVCMLTHENGEEHQLQYLRASSLQCLSAMIWFMAEFSHVFEGLDEIVQVMLENYEPDMNYEDGEMGDQRHNWVDEVVRCEGKIGIAGGDASPSSIIVRPRPGKKDPSSLTREEAENPKVWARICLQRMGELARESTTMRQILEPMLVYFDTGCHWSPQQSLTLTVLSDMCYFLDVLENQQLILSVLIRHLDHKNVVHDPLVKSYVIRKATYLARQIRSGGTLMDTGCIGDLCRHLRKSLQATSGPISEEESNLNVQLQNSIEACLLELAKGMKDAGSLFDLMAITLEKLPPVSVVARSTVGSMVVLAHVFAAATVSPSHQVFPESLLVQLLKAMLHTDTESRIGAHYIFSVLLFPSSNYTKQQGFPWRASCCRDRQRRQSNTSSTFASVTALLEKLRKEKDGFTADKLGGNSLDDCKGADFSEEEPKQGWNQKNSPSICKITSIIDRAGSTSFSDLEPCAMKLSEDQIVQLLSGFWIQANLPDNLPSNYEAIAHSYSWTLLFSHFKNSTGSLVTRFFQLPLSLRNISLDPNCGKLPSACRRSLYVTAMAMLMFAAKIYHMNDLTDLLSSSAPYDVDPCLGISEDLHLYVKSGADVRQYGSAVDNQAATTVLCELYSKSDESDHFILDVLVGHLSNITKADKDDVKSQLLETFSLDEAFIFTPQSVYDLDHIHMFGHTKDSPSVDVELSANSVAEEESISSLSNAPHFNTKQPLSPSISNIISIGQLLESALEAASQVAGTSVSTSPLPYSAMASQCEALGIGTRKKLSNWLVHENYHDAGAEDDGFVIPASPACGQALIRQISNDAEGIHGGDMLAKESSLTLRLPPASPFDNFLRAVAGPSFNAAEVAM